MLRITSGWQSRRELPSTAQGCDLLRVEYWKNGNIDAFVAENRRRARVFGVPAEGLTIIERSVTEMKGVFARGGHVGLNRHLLDQLRYSEDGALAIRLAVLSAAVGDLDAAFVHLDRALESHDPALVHLAVAPQWDGLHEDPRFHQILSRMGLHPVT